MRKLEEADFPNTKWKYEENANWVQAIQPTHWNMYVLMAAHNELVDAFNDLEKKLLRKEDGTYA